MAARLWLCLLVSIVGTRGSVEVARELIVWNVGQGQWVTLIDDRGCWHLDMGGEFAPWATIIAKCRARANFVSLSHWDWDHVGFVSKARMNLPNLCLLYGPLGSASERKERMIRALSLCNPRQAPADSDFATWVNAGGRSTNGLSRVVSWRGVLAPGDSTSAEERVWAFKMRTLSEVRILVVGHHGSRTSTSDVLLARLPHLRVAIASQRRKRYKHPHVEVIRRLEKRQVPLLLTEEWGTILMQL